MRVKRLLWASSFCLLLTGMRDPFQPPPDTCQIAELSRWHFHGMVESAQRVGILRDTAGGWHRVVIGETLPVGWRIIAIDQHEMQIATGEGCHPPQWRWKREGTQNVEKDTTPRVL
ncbi:HofP DNA utilization family protein [Kosakonia sp. BK9b]|uniref:HofP DNA utilization family protein n=1 Tax=Kosakonia sp. TaxID=1916651 RepID=UPI00289E5C1C|nr:HofP DNA utilization family protein [Kosakonia sp.]